LLLKQFGRIFSAIWFIVIVNIFRAKENLEKTLHRLAQLPAGRGRSISMRSLYIISLLFYNKNGFGRDAAPFGCECAVSGGTPGEKGGKNNG